MPAAAVPEVVSAGGAGVRLAADAEKADTTGEGKGKKADDCYLQLTISHIKPEQVNSAYQHTQLRYL